MEVRKVSCIIPAFNESQRIAGVLEAVIKHPLVDEVIVIDDGSTDNTGDVARQCGAVRLITLEQNQGKSKAVMQGLLAARNNLIMLIDADLVGLQKENVTQLIEPVSSGTAKIAIGMVGNAGVVYRWIGLDFVSGQRVFHRVLFDPRLLQSLKCFEIEVCMNNLVIDKGLTIQVISWNNVSNSLKFAKFGWWEGVRRGIQARLEIVKYVTIRGAFRQYAAMCRLARQD